MQSGLAESKLPLVVDLDGTLIKTKLLFELANQYLISKPLHFFKMAYWFLKGKKALKHHLNKISIDISMLPYNQKLLDWIKTQKNEKGRKIILATANHFSLAEQVAAYHKLFDEVFGTDSNTNLKAEKKRDFLVGKYGEGGYDYVGGSVADLLVWESAANAVVISNNKTLIKKIQQYNNCVSVFSSDKPAVLFALLKLLRPHQWLKNLLVMLPLFAAQLYCNEAKLISAIMAFVMFSLTASSVYVLNDLIDLNNDRRHERKRCRPFASGNLSIVIGWIIWPLLLLSSFGLTYFMLPVSFLITLAVYFLLTFAYSLKLKQIAVLDVLTLAGLYTMRIIAGTTAIAVSFSFWLLTFAMFVFFSLALIKRFSELKAAQVKDKEGLLPGRGYYPGDLELVASLGAASGYISVLVLALYIQDNTALYLYHVPQLLWLACPLLLFWISFSWLIAHRGQMHDDPIVFAMKNPVSLIVACLFVGIFVLAKFI
ncbi:MAG: UbiA family prenyltransferase [Gammaproteobacteria bacterium]|nr:UbiA family prenyltransferase [Gammaproteobacteria bacterium]